MSGTDAQGFVGHSARCDAGSTPAAAIRTANSLAIVCETAPGSYYYRGERLSDGAQLQLANAVPAGGGFDAINPADGARYQVRPDQLTISSSRGRESDPALEYGVGESGLSGRARSLRTRCNVGGEVSKSTERKLDPLDEQLGTEQTPPACRRLGSRMHSAAWR